MPKDFVLRTFVIGVLAVVLLPTGTSAQSTEPPIARPIFGPPPPLPPDVVARDEQGRVTVRAVRLTKPLVLDGRLEDEVYRTTPSLSDFVQMEPRQGQPATEKTEAWIFFDDENIYVSARCWDSHPERMIANEMRRDHGNLVQNENFAVSFDTFYDRRNGYAFQTTPLGGMRDQISTDESNANSDWNGVWLPYSARFEQGWTTEMVIPFKTLRYREAGPQIWSVNLRRIVRWKNEWSFLSEVPATYGPFALYKFSSAATLVGLDAPKSLNLELKPYAASSVLTNRQAQVPFSNDLGGQVGFDVKYGLTSSLIADFTYNTDFAQVEADEQQVNLTRFDLFFPEKREFFLEGQGLFLFGAGRNLMPAVGSNTNTPVLFFSRRLGLQQGQSIPILAGGRLTGRAGPYSVGALNLQTESVPAAGAAATNFTVVRLKRNVLRRSNVGVIATRRGPAATARDDNLVWGVDANLAFYENLELTAYYARSQTPGRTGDNASYRALFDYNGDRYGLQLQHLLVGAAFNPEMGFLPRSDFRRNFAAARFSPRPKSIKAVRKFTWVAALDDITDAAATRLETREAQGLFRTELQNSDQFSVEYTRSVEFLPAPFAIASGIAVPVGSYGLQNVLGGYTLGSQRPVSGRLSISRGSFYGGTRSEAGYAGRLEASPHLTLEPRLSWNWVELPLGRFTTRLMGGRVTFAHSPRAIGSALIQYNSSTHAVLTNIRFRWEYAPGSDLFLVYSEGRDTAIGKLGTMQNRGVFLKATRLVRF